MQNTQCLSCSVKLHLNIYIVCNLSNLFDEQFFVLQCQATNKYLYSMYPLCIDILSYHLIHVSAYASACVTCWTECQSTGCFPCHLSNTYKQMSNASLQILSILVTHNCPVDQSTVHACSGRHSCHTEQEASNKQPSTSLDHRLSSKRSRQTNPCKIKTNWHRNMFIEEQVTNAHPHLSQPVVFFPKC